MPTNCSSAAAFSIADFSSRRCRGVRTSAPGTDVLCRASVPTTTFSSAVISPQSRMFWNVLAMPRRVIWCRLILPSGAPSKITVPDVGRYTPVIALKHVVLPAPLGPIRPRISPRLMSNVTASSAVRPPNLTVRSLVSSSGLALGGVHLAVQRRQFLVDDHRLVAHAAAFESSACVQQLSRRLAVGEQLLAHREQTLRPEDHQHHQRQAEEQVLQVAEVDPEQMHAEQPVGQVDDDERAEDHARACCPDRPAPRRPGTASS